jgi:Family of unknown function (DUF6328)
MGIREDREELSLAREAEYLLDECRMVLPGIQALFGFQLIAVFSAGFAQNLTVAAQRLHLLALGLVALAVAIVMTPAAYHRQVGGREVTASFVALSTRLLLWSMAPLAGGIVIDFALIAGLLFDGVLVVLLTAVLSAVFFTLWFFLPRACGLQRLLMAGRCPRLPLEPSGRRDETV